MLPLPWDDEPYSIKGLDFVFHNPVVLTSLWRRATEDFLDRTKLGILARQKVHPAWQMGDARTTNSEYGKTRM